MLGLVTVPAGNVCGTVHVFAFARLRATATTPVVGVIINVPAPESDTLLTAPLPPPHVDCTPWLRQSN
jgi:hypothetical protein